MQNMRYNYRSSVCVCVCVRVCMCVCVCVCVCHLCCQLLERTCTIAEVRVHQLLHVVHGGSRGGGGGHSPHIGLGEVALLPTLIATLTPTITIIPLQHL